MISTILVMIVGIYLFIGLVFSLFFVARGINRVDPVARDAGWGFRLVVIPGVAALWPILYRRWRRGEQPQEFNDHLAVAEMAHDLNQELE